MLALILTAAGIVAMVVVGIWAAHSGRVSDAAQEKRFDALMNAIREENRKDREELRTSHTAALEPLGATLRNFATGQTEQLGGMRREATEGRTALEAAQKGQMDTFSDAQAKRAVETLQALKDQGEKLEKAIAALTKSNDEKQEKIREELTTNLKALREENDAKLEQMRLTVDEKLHESLEKRLGESFKQVSERLEQVHTGLGEMKTLATGVGDLKRVLTNVKSRGGWGEVQLGMLLEDLLTPEQYAKNTRIRPDSAEVVEYAVRLPGAKDGGPLLLPIDCKFPHEDYDRLLAAQDAGQVEEVERFGQTLERAVRLQAKTISDKYVHPPHSTDFAIMYLPTEGLFAEIIRRPGLASAIQSEHRVMLTGPTTLAALLTSLQMGFRTLAIEKRSSEVWQVLGAAKSEFQKYGVVWDKLGKQLEAAQNTVSQAGTRTRALERTLRSVETLDAENTASLVIEEGLDGFVQRADAPPALTLVETAPTSHT
jgi:DNA recombination protein RmuC